jgi:hypothetical protein
MSRDSVRLAFLIAALNNLEVFSFNVGNAYLNAKTSEKVYMIAGPEFGDDAGKIAIIVRALYGLKTSGAAWHSHFVPALWEIGFMLSKADADMWMKPGIKKDGTKYWQYILVHVNDGLCVMEDPTELIGTLHEAPFYFKMKDVRAPKTYLGTTIDLVELNDNVNTWSMLAAGYLEKVLPAIEEKFGSLRTIYKKTDRKKLFIPVLPDYHPEMDETNLLDDDEKRLYQSYIGILRWVVKLGCIDLVHTCATMAKFMAALREGHMAYLLCTFAYLKKYQDTKIIFDPEEVNWNNIDWVRCDWSEFYLDAKEEIPTDAPVASATYAVC